MNGHHKEFSLGFGLPRPISPLISSFVEISRLLRMGVWVVGAHRRITAYRVHPSPTSAKLLNIFWDDLPPPPLRVGQGKSDT